MFVRVDNVLINLDEIHTAFLDTSVLDSRPILKLQMKGGMRSSIDSEADPELVFNVIIEALSSTGQLYSPADPDMPIELSFLEEQELDAVAKQGYKYLARDMSGALFAYAGCPEKRSREWFDGNDIRPQRMRDELFDFIDFDDDAPFSISDLRGF